MSKNWMKHFRFMIFLFLLVSQWASSPQTLKQHLVASMAHMLLTMAGLFCVTMSDAMSHQSYNNKTMSC